MQISWFTKIPTLPTASHVDDQKQSQVVDLFDTRAARPRGSSGSACGCPVLRPIAAMTNASPVFPEMWGIPFRKVLSLMNQPLSGIPSLGSMFWKYHQGNRFNRNSFICCFTVQLCFSGIPRHNRRNGNQNHYQKSRKIEE